MNIRVATWNIHSCIGTDKIFNPRNTIEVLKSLDCDIIALQEVEVCSKALLLEQIAKATNLIPIEGITLSRQNTKYGNVVLTRFPVQQIVRLDLSVPPFEPRGALIIKHNFNKYCQIKIVATHLGLTSHERKKQIDLLLKKTPIHPRGSINILMGDFNEWNPISSNLHKIHTLYGRTSAPLTFPTYKALFALDRIWVHPLRLLNKIEVVKNPFVKRTSDHYPVRATIEIPDCY